MHNRGFKGSGTPFHSNGSNIVKHPPSTTSTNPNPSLYPKETYENTKNSDSILVAQLKHENKQLRMELSQKNKLIEDNHKRINKLEKIVQSLRTKTQQPQYQRLPPPSQHFSGNNGFGQFNVPQQFFNDFFGMNNNNLVSPEFIQDDFYIDPVKEVDDHIMEQLYPNPDHMTYEQLLALEEEVGSVSKGLSKAQVNNLPLVSFSKYLYKNSDKCVICQYEFKNNEKLRKLFCDHLFHKECVDEWLLKDKKCPCCQKEVKV